ncbi:MAG TPA: phosphatidylglycerophosphatase A [Gammaproteobacteria bacterium]|jgi:phosphatidylglycerophosphatase A|nr:phosphatidylglycerophosphatase A [Pseudomonadales bacterium]HIA78149.1 phosphatidylglycerophosphatase A [Gammaproteobacteria bacterium]|tara:strand:+ start:175 stop:645 length:471 start_codon:yes stop_codon:yes gene_type:complete
MSELHDRAAVLLARGFGAGCSPVAPGTVGTAVAVPLVCLQLVLSTEVFLVFVLVFVLGAVYVAAVADKQMDETDDPSIVVDEMAGFLIAMAYVPLTPWSLLGGFVLFRALDIFKPPPINTVERKFSGGLGIVGDDLVAGLMTNALLQLAIWANIFS